MNVETKVEKQHTQEQDIRQRIYEALADLRYGSVEITIHDSKIVQIEKKQKLRF